MNLEKSCGAIVYRVIDHEYLFLIIKSKAHQFYSFPKGHVEQNETDEETALREVFEETNVSILIKPHFKEKIEYSPKVNTKKTVIYFLGEAIHVDVKIQYEEISEFFWLNYNDALNKLTYDSEKQVFKNAYVFLTKK